MSYMVPRHMRSEASTAVKIQVEVFWVVMPYSIVVGYQHRSLKYWYPITTLHGITTQMILTYLTVFYFQWHQFEVRFSISFHWAVI